MLTTRAGLPLPLPLPLLGWAQQPGLRLSLPPCRLTAQGYKRDQTLEAALSD